MEKVSDYKLSSCSSLVMSLPFVYLTFFRSSLYVQYHHHQKTVRAEHTLKALLIHSDVACLTSGYRTKFLALVLSGKVSKELLMLSSSFVITHCLELVHIRSKETIVQNMEQGILYQAKCSSEPRFLSLVPSSDKD